MKRISTLIATLALVLSPLFVRSASAQSMESVRSSVGAIFMTAPEQTRRFICSGSEVGSDSDGNGIFLTARHCVWDENYNKFYQKIEEVTFSDDEKGPFYTTKLYAISETEDLALLKIIGAAKLPTVVLGDEHALKAGDAVINVSYPYDLGKLEFHGNFVSPAFPHYPDPLAEEAPQWLFSMPVDITVEPGSSGSPLFDAKNHNQIGVMVGMFQTGGLTIAEPIRRYYEMIKNLDSNSPEAFVKAHPVYSPKDQVPDGGDEDQ